MTDAASLPTTMDATVDLTVERSARTRPRLGTVSSYDPRGGIVDVTMDDGGTIQALNAGAGYLLAGDRAWIMFAAPQGAFVLGRVSDWWHTVDAGASEPPYENGWATQTGAFGAARFFRDEGGLVEVTGNVVHAAVGGTGTVIFTFGARYRPGNQRQFPVNTGAGATTISVLTNGQVVFDGTDGQAQAGVSLDGISNFLAEG